MFMKQNIVKLRQTFFAQPEGEWKTIECEGVDTAHAGILQNFADAVDGNAEIFVEGTEGCKSLMLANAMYLSSWKKQMIEIPKTKEKEVAFEMEYEIELLKKQST